MHRTVCFVMGAVLVAATSSAQAPAGGQKFGLAAALQRSYNGIKLNLTEAAQKMPAEDYSYRPSPEIRTYGGQLGHVADFHYVFCAAAKGEANPLPGNTLEKKSAKEEIVKALADSFAYCDRVFASLTDDAALQLVRQGQNEVARGGVLTNLIAHDNEEYGILTVYLRTKSMVPPSTERQQRGRGAGRGRQ